MTQIIPDFVTPLRSDCWTPNSTAPCRYYEHNLGDGIIYIINQFICLFGLMGNGTVLWCLRRCVMKKPIIIYILSLALADFAYLLCCLFVILVFSVEYFSGHYCFPWCKVLFTVYKVELFLYSTGMYFLMTISTERCLCTLFPFWYRCRRPGWLSGALAVVLWSLAALLCGVNICALWGKTGYQEMDKAITVVNLSFVTPIMILSSLILFTKVRCSSQQQQLGQLSITILLTVFFFIIFATPLSIKHLFKDSNKVPNMFYLLASVNSSINPAIYFLVGCRREKWFSEPLSFVLQRALNEERNSKKGVVYNTDRQIKNNQGQKKFVVFIHKT
ncbi:mas-related G-protein coupled receptor member H-like [Sceloporus undulatus]|uniref:mas-related G-protein coupled receptor member H-like n=1 Tax=Sceloporus undulatus TaxID=8520 RepID=UPI001C4C89A7|nr:mas-related G-protein coupled receptor member H-like [Sceloporus undulatus]